MFSHRWKSPLLACAVMLPMFGCATNRLELTSRSIPIQAIPIQAAPGQRGLSAGYLETLDRRIQQSFGQVRLAVLSPPRQTSDQPAAPAADQPGFDQRILVAHNRERSGLGLTPLSWNPALARSARRWADHLAMTGRFEHAPENYAAPEGENLWAGTKGYFTPEAMVNAWIREKRFFRPGSFPDNSTTGRVEDVGHYTQLVWRATTEVGCAEAASAGEDILVCRYAEAGNYRGEQPF
jgi:hypothetical protein